MEGSLRKNGGQALAIILYAYPERLPQIPVKTYEILQELQNQDIKAYVYPTLNQKMTESE